MAAAIPEPTEAVEETPVAESTESSPLTGHQITEEDVAAAQAATEEETEAPEPEVEATEEEEEVPTEETPETPEADDTPDLIDIATLSEEFNSADGPSDETRQALIDALGTKFANPEAILEQFVEGQKHAGAAAAQTAYGYAGGEESYNAMTQWASNNLDEGTRVAYNEAIQNPALVQMAITGLHAQYALATGQGETEHSPQRVAPSANVSAGVSPVTSTEQIAELTADPRFDRDPAFRASVEQRIRAGMTRS